MECSAKEKEALTKTISLVESLGRTHEPMRALDDALRSLLRKEKRKRAFAPESSELMNRLKEIRQDTTGTSALILADSLNPRILKKVCFSDVSAEYASLETYRHKVSDGMAGAGFSPMYQTLIKYGEENKAKALLIVDKLIRDMTAEEGRRIGPNS